jgi:hypothetical protein
VGAAAAEAEAEAEAWQKQLAGGDVAVLLLNRGGRHPMLNITLPFASLPGAMFKNASARVGVTDVWTGASEGVARGGLTRAVPAHGTVVLRLRLLADAE